MTEKGWFTQASDAAAEKQRAYEALKAAAQELVDAAKVYIVHTGLGHDETCAGVVIVRTGEFERCNCYMERHSTAIARVEELLS